MTQILFNFEENWWTGIGFYIYNTYVYVYSIFTQYFSLDQNSILYYFSLQNLLCEEILFWHCSKICPVTLSMINTPKFIDGKIKIMLNSSCSLFFSLENDLKWQRVESTTFLYHVSRKYFHVMDSIGYSVENMKKKKRKKITKDKENNPYASVAFFIALFCFIFLHYWSPWRGNCYHRFANRDLKRRKAIL